MPVVQLAADGWQADAGHAKTARSWRAMASLRGSALLSMRPALKIVKEE